MPRGKPGARQKEYRAALALTNDSAYAAYRAGYVDRPPHTRELMADVQEMRTRWLLNRGIPLSIQAFEDALKSETAIQHRTAAAQFLFKEFREQHAQEVGGGEKDASEMTPAELAARIDALQAQAAALAKEVPSDSVIDDAETITDDDPFG